MTEASAGVVGEIGVSGGSTDDGGCGVDGGVATDFADFGVPGTLSRFTEPNIGSRCPELAGSNPDAGTDPASEVVQVVGIVRSTPSVG